MPQTPETALALLPPLLIQAYPATMSLSEAQRRKQRFKGGKGGPSSTGTTHPSITSVPWFADRKQITQSAVKNSLAGGEFIDTKFYAYSRRTITATVDRPKPVYANSAVLKASCKYFEGCESDESLFPAISSWDAESC